MFSLPYFFLFLYVDGVPPIKWPGFLWATGSSFVVNVLAWYLFYRAIAVSPVYLTMPFTALTPLFTVPVAFLLIGEIPGILGAAGIILVIVGAYSIHLRKGNLLSPLRSLWSTSGTRLMLIVAFVWSISATVEKVAVLSSSAAFYAVTIHSLLAIAYLPIVIFRQRQALRLLPANLIPFLILGGVTAGVAIFQFTALNYLDVSYVIAFKRAGVIISVFLGYWFFGEGRIWQHLAATTVIILGAILISVG